VAAALSPLVTTKARRASCRQLLLPSTLIKKGGSGSIARLGSGLEVPAAAEVAGDQGTS
jgi:hypothetical protein